MPLEMNIELNKFELERLRRKLEQTQGAVGITTQWLVWDSARLAAKDAMKYSAPWANGKPGNTNAQLSAGKMAIAYDLIGSKSGVSRKAKRQGVFDFLSESVARTFVAKDVNVMVNVTKDGRVYAKDVDLYRPDASIQEMERHHFKYRLKNGRTTQAASETRDIGRWKSTAKMRVRREKFMQYLRHVQSRIGQLKASWLPAEEYFAKKVGANVRVPSWIVSQPRSGGYSDTINKDGNGSCIVSNAARHSTAIRKDIINFIQRQRQKFLTNMSEKRMQQIADQFNRQNSVQPIRQTA